MQIVTSAVRIDVAFNATQISVNDADHHPF